MKNSKVLFFIGLLILTFYFGTRFASTPSNPNPISKSNSSKVANEPSSPKPSTNPNSNSQKTPTSLATQTSTPSTTLQTTTTTKITRIVDGDTVVISSGQKLRLIGINTPESGQPYYKEAADTLSKLTLNKTVELEKDVSETDKYGRLLRYINLNGKMINEEMVRLGFARVVTYPPDVKYSNRLIAAEKEARQAQLGLWSPVSPPPATNGLTQSPPGNCIIKGNISSSGKIYHLPGGAYYDKTQIDESAGERWFCTESEAQSAGWRPSQR